MNHDPEASEVLEEGRKAWQRDPQVSHFASRNMSEFELDALTAAGLAVIRVRELERYKAALFLACRDGWSDGEGAMAGYLDRVDAWLDESEGER